MSLLQIIALRLYQLRQGITNLIIWFPVIWSDRQYDQAYLYSILLQKIKLKRKFFYSRHAMTADASTLTAPQLQQVEEALERLKDADYLPVENFLDYERGIIDYLAWGEAEEKLIERDLDIVFSVMRENIRSWWD